MNNKKSSKGISRRESLKIGAGLVAGMAATSSGIQVFAIGTADKASNEILIPDPEKNQVNIIQPTQSAPDWLQDMLVVPAPAAAVGGCQSGIFTPAQNGIYPWRNSLIRWLTSRNLQANGGVLIRQEGTEGGAGLSVIVDPRASYMFSVSVHLPGKGSGFGGVQDESLQVWATVLDVNDQMIAEEKVKLIPGDWSSCQVSFDSNSLREVKCIVQARSPKKLPCVYFAEAFHLIRNDNAWWNPQNLFNASRTAVRLNDERETMVKTLDPDLVGGHNGVYLNWDGFFTRHGIAVGGGHWEQEYDTLSVDDPVVDQFREDGLARELDGNTIMGGRLWPGYHMCHNSSAWHSYYKQRLIRVAPDVQQISQDNICNPSFMQFGKGCFCRGCRDGFRSWIRQHWTNGQLHAIGIDNPDSLDIVEYVRKAQGTISKGRDAVLADPVLRGYIQFSYASQADRWRDSVMTVKREAGHPIAVHGNQYGAGGRRPYSVSLSQISDLTWTETGVGEGPMSSQMRAWNALATKLGLASGEYRRPVWLGMTSLFHTPIAAKSRLRMVNGQTWADGGVPTPWATAAGSSGWYYDTEARICRFIQKHRSLFARRDRYANVGLVYSLPTHAWRNFPAFGLSALKYQEWFASCAQLLEELHIPYEINCWWHSLLGDDTISMERISRYKALILPGVDCFSDAQREAVRAFQAQGGQVISVACQTLYDSDGVKRPDGQTLATPGRSLTEINPDQITRYSSANAKISSENSAELQTTSRELKSILNRVLAGIRLLETDAPQDTWSNVWMDDTRQVLALHLVNGDIDDEYDRFRPVEKSQWRVRLPEGLKVTEALMVSPDDPDEIKQLPVKVSRDWVTVVVPRIESYSIVAIYSGKAFNAAVDVANVRRSIMQTIMKNGEQGDTVADARLKKVLSLLRSGRIEEGAQAADELIRIINPNYIRITPVK